MIGNWWLLRAPGSPISQGFPMVFLEDNGRLKSEARSQNGVIPEMPGIPAFAKLRKGFHRCPPKAKVFPIRSVRNLNPKGQRKLSYC